MTSTELEYAERRMQQKWYDLVTAEQQGTAPQTLERMFNAYMLAVEDYNRRSAALAPISTPELASQHEVPAAPVPSTRTSQQTPSVSSRRKAS